MAATDFIKQLESKAQKIYREKLGVKKLTKQKKDVIVEICSSIVECVEREDWDAKLEDVINNPISVASLCVNDGVLALAAEHELSTYPAAILYHSTKIENAAK